MFEKIVYEDRQITTITVEWKDDFSKAMSVLKTFFNDNNTVYLMLDLRDSSIDTITYDDVSDLYWYAKSRANDNGENRVNGKTALVGSRDLQSEIGSIFNTCFEMDDSAINVSVFHSEKKALSWLEEG
jgi:hypothetical protein